MGGIWRKAIYPHSHFHIFESLPGLNGSWLVLPGDQQIVDLQTLTGQHEAIVIFLDD